MTRRKRRAGDYVFFFLIATPLFLFAALVAGLLLGGVGLVITVPLALASVVVVLREPPRWLENAGCGVMVSAAVLWLAAGGTGCAVFTLWRHLEVGSEYCHHYPLIAQRETCDGRDQSFLQGRHNFSEATGTPDREHCKALLAKIDVPLEPDKEEELHRVACPPSWSDAPRTCFGSESLSSSNDMYRLLYGFTADCTSVRAWGSTNVAWDEMPAQLGTLDGRVSGRTR